MSRTACVVVVFVLACMTLGAQQAPPAPGGARAGGRGGRGPAPTPRILSFEAKPSSIKPGQTVTLVWSTENPSALTLEPGIGRVVPRGSRQVTPVATTTYTLSMPGPDGTAVTRSVTVTVAGTKPVASAATGAETGPKPIARTPEGKPDFSGVYAFGGGGGGGGRGGRGGRGAAPAADGVVRTPTLKPGAEKYRVQRGPQDTGRTADCMPLIPPDSFGVPYQFQIIQNKDFLVLIHEYPGTFRLIPLDGEPHQVDPDPTWLGDSIGRWEGDTLVVDTIGYNEKTEIAGYRHTDALHTVERFRRIEDGFEYEITIEDPNVFVEPWTQTRTFRFNVPPLKKVMEFVCENNRDYRPLFGQP